MLRSSRRPDDVTNTHHGVQHDQTYGRSTSARPPARRALVLISPAPRARPRRVSWLSAAHREDAWRTHRARMHRQHQLHADPPRSTIERSSSPSSPALRTRRPGRVEPVAVRVLDRVIAPSQRAGTPIEKRGRGAFRRRSEPSRDRHTSGKHADLARPKMPLPWSIARRPSAKMTTPRTATPRCSRPRRPGCPSGARARGRAPRRCWRHRSREPGRARWVAE